MEHLCTRWGNESTSGKRSNGQYFIIKNSRYAWRQAVDQLTKIEIYFTVKDHNDRLGSN